MKINPNYQHPYINLGITLRYLAEYEMSQGHDPSATLQRAVDANQKGLDISADAIDQTARADIHIVEAINALIHKRSPESALSKVKKFLESAKILDSSNYLAYSLQGKADLIQAKWQRVNGKSADGFLISSQQNLTKAIELNSLDAGSYVLFAESQLLQRKNIDAGLQNIEKALKLNPQFAEAYAIQGLLLLEKGDRDSAESSLQKALSLNKNLAYLYSKYSL